MGATQSAVVEDEETEALEQQELELLPEDVALSLKQVLESDGKPSKAFQSLAKPCKASLLKSLLLSA